VVTASVIGSRSVRQKFTERLAPPQSARSQLSLRGHGAGLSDLAAHAVGGRQSPRIGNLCGGTLSALCR